MAAILFDLDGVIIDTEGAYTLFWDSIEKIYPTGISDFAHAIKGTNLNKILLNYDSEDVRNDIVNRLDLFEADMDFPVYDAITDFLDSLSDAGIRCALVTSSADSKMAQVYQKLPWLRSRFDVIVTGSMVTHSKPDPEGYLTAARLLGEDPSRCVVAEDSIQGLQAGRAAGAKVIGLTTTNSRKAVEPLADEVLDSWTGYSVERLLALLES